MIILDEDIDVHQRARLAAWKVHFRRVGKGVGRFGMKDRTDIVPLLHQLRRPTFCSRDHGFYDRALCHPGYCLVYLDVRPNEAAAYLRRFLRHTAFRTQAQRMSKVVRVRHSGVTWWKIGSQAEHALSW